MRAGRHATVGRRANATRNDEKPQGWGTLGLDAKDQPRPNPRKEALDRYLRFYNYRRPHTSLGRQSPWTRLQEAVA
jgi:transposase InsO family protein